MKKKTCSLSEDLKAEIERLRPELYAYRRQLHSHPEPSGKEYNTSEMIRRKLESFGYEVKTVGGTGLYTRLQGAGSGQSIMLRADIDALPLVEDSGYPWPSENAGYMHACGHDVHAAALLGAAHYLIIKKEKLRGSVSIVFQHAEEQGHGSQNFLKENLTEGVERIYGFHVYPEAKLGTVHLTEGADFASCDRMKIRLQGKSSHIAKPHQGCDASLAAAAIILQLRELKGGLDPLQTALIGIGKIRSGTAWNIISDEAEIEGTVRTFSMEYRKDLLQRVEDVIQKVSALYGVSAQTEFELNAPCLVNDPGANKEMYLAASACVGEENVIKRTTPIGFGADDFAAFSEQIPGSFLHLGTAIKEDPRTQFPLHSPNLYIPDEAVGIGCEILIRCALEHLE